MFWQILSLPWKQSWARSSQSQGTLLAEAVGHSFSTPSCQPWSQIGAYGWGSGGKRRSGCWGTYAYMHIYTKSIQIYFGIFFDFIVAFHSFHCSHTVTNFLILFPIFPAILCTSKACHFDTALLILLPFECPCSCMSCRIKSYYMQHAHSLRRAEWS